MGQSGIYVTALPLSFLPYVNFELNVFFVLVVTSSPDFAALSMA
jgi:hypothetical protein